MHRRESAQKGRSDSKHAGAVHNWSEPSGGSIYFFFLSLPLSSPYSEANLIGPSRGQV